MKKNDTAPSAAAVLGAAVLVGFALTLFSMAGCALAVLFGGLPPDGIGLCAGICLSLGSIFAGFLAAKRSVSWRPLWGIAAGILLFGCLVILSLAWFDESVQFPRLLINAMLSIVFSAVGGALGNTKVRRKKHRNKH